MTNMRYAFSINAVLTSEKTAPNEHVKMPKISVKTPKVGFSFLSQLDTATRALSLALETQKS